MKTSAVRSDSFAAIRRRNLAQAGAQTGRAVTQPDQADLLGLSEAELTPAVQTALAALSIELEDLRGEARRLKMRLAEAEAAADQDPLTSARNRRAFVRELRRVAAFAQRYGQPASLVYFDLDDLKAINDRFGHAAGDAPLQAVAAPLPPPPRQWDVVGRMGGDEFAVLLEQADLAVAEAKAETLARLVCAEPVKAGEWLAPLRLSWGACQIDPTKDPETMIAAADAAMFAMKRAR